MPSSRWLYACLLGLASSALHPAAAYAELYEFTIRSSAADPGHAVGVGDPARSQALRLASGDVLVAVPLDSLVVQLGSAPPFQAPRLGFLDVRAPAPGITLTAPAPGYSIDLGGAPPDPACFAGSAACTRQAPYVSVGLVGLPVDVWGRFESRAGGEVWVANPSPGVRFTALPVLGSQDTFPGLFSMRPLIAEPPIALLFALAIGAACAARPARRR